MNDLFTSPPWLALTVGTLVSLGPAYGTSIEPSPTPSHDYEAPAPGTYELPTIARAADGAVLDSSGHPHQLDAFLRGRVTVLSFIYTRCASAQACPRATGVLNQLHRASQEDPRLAQDLQLLSLSFDPAIDTPARMANYAALYRGRTNAAEWRFLTTPSARQLQPILDAYGQAVDRKANPRDPTGPLNHTLRVFLIDAAGNIRNIYSSATLDPRVVLADIRTLLAEATSGGSTPSTLPAAGHARTEDPSRRPDS